MLSFWKFSADKPNACGRIVRQAGVIGGKSFLSDVPSRNGVSLLCHHDARLSPRTLLQGSLPMDPT